MRRFTAGHHYGSRDSLFWRCAPRISPLNSLLASVVRNLTKVEMPALSPTMSSGTIVSWKKKIGDPIAPGDVFCEVQTDKATLDYENVADEGFLARILKKEGADPVKVGEIIALLVENESELNSDEVTKFKSEIDIQPKETKDAVVNDQPTQTNQSLPRENTPVPVSPYARTLAKELNIDPTTLKPSGGVGSIKRVTSDDVRRYAASCENNSLQKVAAVSKTLDTQNPSNTAHPKVAKSSIQEKLVSASGSINTKYEDIPLTSMRRIIAARLHQSKNIEVPHYYTSMDISVQSAMQVIAHLRQKTQQKISINDYIIRVVAKASMVIPEARTHFITGSDVNTYNGSDTFLRKYNSVDVSVAVATEGGLLTPIVRDADRKGIAEISSEVKALAAKAREGTLRPEEYQGGTISVSNLGSMGVHHFTAIINPPQSVILAVGTTRYRHRITSQPPTGTVEPALATLGKPMYLSNEAEPYITCTASFDHRVIDGAIGAKWMQQVQEYIENPLSLLA